MPWVSGLSIAALAAGLLVAGVARRFAAIPGWQDQRWFGLVAISAAAYCASDIVVPMDVSAQTTLLGARCGFLCIGINAAAWYLHSGAHLGLPETPTSRRLAGFAIVGALVGVLPGVAFTDEIVRHQVPWLGLRYAEPILRPVGGALIAYFWGLTSVATVRYARALGKHPEARLYLVALSALLVAGANDGLASTGQFPLPYLLDVSFLVVVTSTGIALTRRFAEGARRLEDVSRRLESLLEARTAQLDQTRGDLAQAQRLASLGQLAAGVAHEISNPIAAVASNLSFLRQMKSKQGEWPPDTDDALRESLDASHRISHIVQRLRDTGRIAGQHIECGAAADVTAAVESALATVRRSCGSLKTHLELEVAGEPPWAFVDKHTLEEAVTNLVVNGVQAIPSDRTDGKVAIRCERQGERVLLAVTDNGRGISPEAAPRVFEPFFTTKPFGEGTGLGLSVSLGLMRAVGGDLRLTHTSPEGTTMTIELGAAPAPEPTSPSARPPSSPGTSGVRLRA